MSQQAKTHRDFFRYLGLLGILVLGIASILASGGSGGGGSTPVITSASPPQSSDSAVVTALVEAQFSIDMDGSSFDASSFTLVDDTANNVSASTISYDPATRIATFEPDTDLLSGNQYIATITTAVRNASGGAPLASDYVWSFNVAPTLVPVSQDINGVFGNRDSDSAALDETGRYVVFVSKSDFNTGVSSGGIDQVYLKDTVTGAVTTISTDPSGLIAGDLGSSNPAISADGRYIAYNSSATNLISGDTNGSTDIFLYDTQTTTTTRVSVVTGGAQANGASILPTISSDGRYIAFQSGANNLVIPDANGTLSDIYLHDTQTTTTTRVSVDSAGVQGSSGSFVPSISGDGRYIAFESSAVNLVPGDTNSFNDVFVHDTQTPSTVRVSVNTAGTQGNEHSSSAAISADGRYVAFQSLANNLDSVTPDTNTVSDVFLRDTQTTPSTIRVSVTTAGAQADLLSINPSISADGQYIAFESNATDLVPGDTNGSTDIFLRDVATPQTVRLSLDENGLQTGGHSTNPAISANSRYIGFTASPALVSGDTNGLDDIYRAHRSLQ